VNKEVVILVAEDDEAHIVLIQRNLKRAGITNQQVLFRDGRAVIDFVHRRGERQRVPDTAYLLLLDIKMPDVNGVEVLRQLKADPGLRKMPVIMVTTTDDPEEVARCHELGCSGYVTKPVDYGQFVEAIHRLGQYLLVVEVPKVD
jgi:CheY-like chemotaxis protein